MSALRTGQDLEFVFWEDLASRMKLPERIILPEALKNKKLEEWRMETEDTVLLRYFFRNLKPKRHLEFGTWEGAGTLCCLEECDAAVWTINLPEGEKSPDGRPLYRTYSVPVSRVCGSGFLARLTRFFGKQLDVQVPSDGVGCVGRLYRAKGFGRRVCQIYCDSREFDTTHYPFDFFDTVLVDGGHQKDVVVSDTQKALKVLRSKGVILWHDFCPIKEVQEKCPSIRGVYEAIDSLHNIFNEELSDIFWVNPSWLLVGVRK